VVKMKRLNRVLALLLTLATVIGMVQMSAMAAPTDDFMGGTDPNYPASTPGGPDGIPDIYQVVFEFRTEEPSISNLDHITPPINPMDPNPNHKDNGVTIGDSIYIVKTRLDDLGNPTADTSVPVELLEKDIPIMGSALGVPKVFVWWEDSAGNRITHRKIGTYYFDELTGEHLIGTVFTAHFEDDVIGEGVSAINYSDGIPDICQVRFEFEFDSSLHGYSFNQGWMNTPFSVVKTRYTDATQTDWSLTADVSLSESDIPSIYMAVVPNAGCVFDYWEITTPETQKFANNDRTAPATERTAYGMYNGSPVSQYVIKAYGLRDRIGIGPGNPPIVDIHGNWYNGVRPDGRADVYQILFSFDVDAGGTLVPDNDTAGMSTPLNWVGTKYDSNGKFVVNKADRDAIEVNVPANAVPAVQITDPTHVVYWSDDTNGIIIGLGATAPVGDYVGKWDDTLGYYTQDFTAHFAEDLYGAPEDTDNPIPTPDGIPDIVQVPFNFVAGSHGTLSLGTLTNCNKITVYGNLLDGNGNYSTSGSATLTAAEIPTTNPDNSYRFNRWTDSNGSLVNMASKSITSAATFTANFTSTVNPPVNPGPGIPSNPNPSTPPLMPFPELEKVVHLPYIFGYEDGTVRPNAQITRAEVATILFRLLTEKSKNEFLSSVNNFSDVNSADWYNEAISTMANAGVLQGYPDGTVKPNAPVTRAELVTMVSRFEVLSSGSLSFSDVPSRHWARQYIISAAIQGWIEGYTDGTFKPDSSITRAETAAMLNRVIGRDKLEPSGEDANTWTDNADDAWYYEAIQSAGNNRG